jgi:hypothetical protein
MVESLSDEELSRINSYVRDNPMSLAVVRTPQAPTELRPLFESIAEACALSFMRSISAPTSDFGFAELNSNDRVLVVLYIGGASTELVSLSETDDIFLKDLEDAVSSSNIQSSTIRDGL